MTSNVIVFLSIFLGIVTGEQTIEVAVSSEVDAVEIRVDGELVQEIFDPPWRVAYDFGPELTTHELTAVALNKAGREISRAVQLLNVPRGRVEAEILLEDWVDGSPTVARVVWHSAEVMEPLRTAITLDGVPLAAPDTERVELPTLDPEVFHFLAAELVFPDREVATTEVVFGGAYGTGVETELTAVPLRVGLRKVRSPAATSGWLRTTDGRDLPIVALDESAAEVAVVREDTAIVPLAQLDARMRQTRDFNYKALRLGRRDQLRFVSTRPSSSLHPSIRYDVFPISRAYSPKDGALPALIAGVFFKGDNTPAQQLTDAVAIAGRFLVESRKRRAVLVIAADCASISGQYSAQSVRRYLAELHVPLVVWQTGPVRKEKRDQGLCATAEEIDTAKRFSAAVRRLRNELDRQQIAWVRGRPLPRQIEIAGAPRGVTLAGQ